jgi:hypothetical protein
VWEVRARGLRVAIVYRFPMRPLWRCPKYGERFISANRFSKVLDGVSRHYKACYVPIRTEAEVGAEIVR